MVADNALFYMAWLRLCAAMARRAELDARRGDRAARAWLAWLRTDDGRRDGRPMLNLKN